jgi:hypothetical protein
MDVRIRIAAAWTSVMFLYIYADYFGLYVPGTLQAMLEGRIPPLGPVTQGILMFTSAMMAIPSLMIFLTLALRPRLSRWLNVIIGLLYTAIILMTMWSWDFYIFYGVIEVTLTLLVVWYAWTWPRQEKD